MKAILVRSIAILAVAVAVVSCGTSKSACCASPGSPSDAKHAHAAIPDRPEKLTFPPFEFKPPTAEPYRVPLQSGAVAYVAEDRELPLVNISILVRTGSWLEPEGKEGLADLCGNLLTRSGTTTRTAQELEERLAFLAAMLNSGIGGAQGNVSLNLLSKDLDEGLTILREVLTQPRFQPDRIELQKQQMLQRMKQRNDDSATIEGFESNILAYGEKFWNNRHQTADSVAAVTREDLLAFHQRWFSPSNFVLAVSGDFDRAEMIKKLETLFADWPIQGETPPPVPSDVTLAKPGVYVVDKEVNQGRVSMMLPGIMRDHPDYFAVTIMNDILGGGGFTSRLVNRVRSDEGLAYAVSSSFPGGVYFPNVFRAGFQSKSRTVPYAISIVLEEMKRIAAEAVAEGELENAKRGFIERLPRTFASKAQIVNVLANEEFTGRYFTHPDYWQTVAAKIQNVTGDDVKRVAEKYLTPERLVILVVGDKKEILKGHPNHPVKLTDFSKNFVELPLRDPLTMKPTQKTDAN